MALAILVVGTTPVLAHKLKVFAAADGARIEGTAYFAGGAKATGAKLIVTDAAGTVLATLKPAEDGSFRYQASAPMEHRIIAETIDGHRAEWRIMAAELTGGFPSHTQDARRPAAEAPPLPGQAETVSTGDPPPPPIAAGLDPGLDPWLDAAIEGAVARQIHPLREELLATRDALRLRDILGGIGYIFGLAGLALWWHGRHPGRRG